MLEVADVLLDLIEGDEVGVDVVLVVRVDVELVLVGDEVVLEPVGSGCQPASMAPSGLPDWWAGFTGADGQ